MSFFDDADGLNARGRNLLQNVHSDTSRIWRLTDPAFSRWFKRALDPHGEIERDERRRTARRAVDNLLR